MDYCATYAHEDIMLQKLLPAGSVIFTKSSYSAMPVNKTSCPLPYAYVVLQIAICNLEIKIILIFFVIFFWLINHKDDDFLREFSNLVRETTVVTLCVTTVSHQERKKNCTSLFFLQQQQQSIILSQNGSFMR